MKQCPQCHHTNLDGAHFCVGCGAELTRQCNACGKNIPPDARFCPNCGAVIVSEPPVPWLDRKFTPEVRQALFAVARGIGITLLLMAFVTALLTPPPRIFDDLLLLVVGAAVMVLAEIIKPDRKPRPPGGDRFVPDIPPPDGIRLTPPDTIEEPEPLGSQRNPPPGSTQGPFLN